MSHLQHNYRFLLTLLVWLLYWAPFRAPDSALCAVGLAHVGPVAAATDDEHIGFPTLIAANRLNNARFFAPAGITVGTVTE